MSRHPSPPEVPTRTQSPYPLTEWTAPGVMVEYRGDRKIWHQFPRPMPPRTRETPTGDTVGVSQM